MAGPAAGLFRWRMTQYGQSPTFRNPSDLLPAVLANELRWPQALAINEKIICPQNTDETGNANGWTGRTGVM
jgi:hypothetical protein